MKNGKFYAHVYFFFIGGIVVSFLFLISCKRQVDDSDLSSTKNIEKGEILAKVNQSILSIDDFNTIVEDPDLPIGVLNEHVDEWVETELLYQEAKRLKLDEKPEIALQIRELERYVLSAELLRLKIESQVEVSEERLQTYYTAHQDEFKRDEDEVHVEGVSFFDESVADKVYQKIRQGVSFDQIMDDYDGSDFGYMTSSWELSPEIAETAFKMRVGQISKPIVTEMGVHIIRVIDTKPAGSVRVFEAIKTELGERLSNENYTKLLNEYLENLRSNADIYVDLEQLR